MPEQREVLVQAKDMCKKFGVTVALNHVDVEVRRGEILAELCAGEQDRRLLFQLVDEMWERAAQLITIELTAIMEEMQVESTPLNPICIAAEGSTFYFCAPLHQKILYYMEQYAHHVCGLHFTFVKAEEPTLIGSGYAASGR